MNDREPQQESAQSVSVCVRTSGHTGVRMCVCKETERKKRERAPRTSLRLHTLLRRPLPPPNQPTCAHYYYTTITLEPAWHRAKPGAGLIDGQCVRGSLCSPHATRMGSKQHAQGCHHAMDGNPRRGDEWDAIARETDRHTHTHTKTTLPAADSKADRQACKQRRGCRACRHHITNATSVPWARERQLQWRRDTIGTPPTGTSNPPFCRRLEADAVFFKILFEQSAMTMSAEVANVPEPRPAAVPTLSLASFSLEASDARDVRLVTTYCTEGHPRRALFAQAGKDSIHILTADQTLVQTLSMAEALAAASTKAETSDATVHKRLASPIQSICLTYNAKRGETLLLAAAAHLVVIWAAAASTSSSSASARWRVQAVLNVGLRSGGPSLPEGSNEHQTDGAETISHVDADKDVVLVGTDRGLSVWQCPVDASNRWSRIWRVRTPRPIAMCHLCHGEPLFAAFLRGDRTVSLWSLEPSRGGVKAVVPVRTGALRHSRPLHAMHWRKEPEENR